MTSWTGLDRRRFPRAQCPCLVTIRKEDAKHDAILTHTENVGIGGICVILKQSMKMFSPVELELDLLDFKEPLKCQGKVVWCVKRRTEESQKPLFYDTGIEFNSLSEEERQRVEGMLLRVFKHKGAVL